MKHKLKLFYTNSADNHFGYKKNAIKQEIYNAKEDYILTVGEHQYIEHLEAKYRFDFPEIFFEKLTASREHRSVQKQHNSQRYERREVITFHIPYEGEIEILKLRPNPYDSSIGTILLYDTSTMQIIIDIINYGYDAKRILRERDNRLSYITNLYETLRKNVEDFHVDLPNYIRSVLDKRKEEILNSHDLMKSLNVPLNKKHDTAKTFSVPKPTLRKKVKIERPTVMKEGFKPEPTLSFEDYSEILKIINDVGKNFERLPSTYHNKDEESLRDHIILTLDPNFELGSAGGETFNKSGKTDILLRYDSSVVFIAECKFWKGIKNLHDTIDQLLGYLTWRDSKTAIVLFVKNKNISKVMTEIEQGISDHQEFVKFNGKQDENWYDYVFKLPGDTSREIRMNLLLFHLPN